MEAESFFITMGIIIYVSNEVHSTCLPSEAVVITENTKFQPIVNIGSSSTTLISRQHFPADIHFNVNNTAMVPYRKCSKPVDFMAYEEICQMALEGNTM